MADFIDRQAAIKAIKAICPIDTDCEGVLLDRCDVLYALSEIPSASRYVEHRLKILPDYFEAIIRGDKRFELRRDDRGYHVGDHIWLCEWDGKEFTGRSLTIIQIKYILRNCPEYGLEDGYCIIGW